VSIIVSFQNWHCKLVLAVEMEFSFHGIEPQAQVGVVGLYRMSGGTGHYAPNRSPAVCDASTTLLPETQGSRWGPISEVAVPKFGTAFFPQCGCHTSRNCTEFTHTGGTKQTIVLTIKCTACSRGDPQNAFAVFQTFSYVHTLP